MRYEAFFEISFYFTLNGVGVWGMDLQYSDSLSVSHSSG